MENALFQGSLLNKPLIYDQLRPWPELHTSALP